MHDLRVSGTERRRYLRDTWRSLALLLALSRSTMAQGYEIWEVDGAVPSGSLGYSVASAGDVDGDGVPDVIAGAPFAGPVGAFGVGEVRVFSGATGALLYVSTGGTTQDNFGYSVAGVGDVDGDGLDDLLVGAPFADPGGTVDAGQGRVLSGATGATLLTVNGTAGGGFLGRAVAGVGDVNGDGVPDIALGSPGSTSVKASVRSGSTGALLFPVTGPPGWFGSPLSAAGDVDADGATDLIVGGSGQARVHSGATGASLYVFTGPAGDGFAGSVSGPGDVNGDGHADLLVGVPRANPGGLDDAGQALVFSGLTGSVLSSVDGSVPNERLGSTVAGTGDLDGDGLGDAIVVTAPFIYFPGCYDCSTDGDGAARAYSGASGAVLVDIPSFGCQRLGYSAGPAGDLNGDGVPEVLVGIPELCPGDAVPPLLGHARAVSIVGLPAGSYGLGQGCTGAGGLVPRISTFGGATEVGNESFGISISGAPGGTFALLFAGTYPNPSGISVGSCAFYLAGSVDPIGPVVHLAGPPGADGGGWRLLGVGIPQDPSLSGGSVHLQWAALDPAGPNGVFTTSDALSLTIP